MLPGNLNLAPQFLHDELQAVADAQNGDVFGLHVVDELGGEAGRALGVDAVRAAGEDDSARVQFGDGLQSGGAADAEGEDVEGANSAGDEMRVLRAEV